MSDTPVNIKYLAELLEKTKVSAEYSEAILRFCKGGDEEAIKDIDIMWLLLYCDAEISEAVFGKATDYRKQRRKASEVRLTFGKQKREKEMDNHLDIIARRDDYYKVINALILLGILSSNYHLIDEYGNKKIFIGVMKLMIKYGYFKAIEHKTGKKMKLKTIEAFITETFKPGNLQHLRRKTNFIEFTSAAIAKVKIIEEIEQKRYKINPHELHTRN